MTSQKTHEYSKRLLLIPLQVDQWSLRVDGDSDSNNLKLLCV